ncbi:MAG: hypothetical protein HOE32_09680 [Nitrospina sp.]|nr:hypothetical protein [Nitrospina sp.]
MMRKIVFLVLILLAFYLSSCSTILIKTEGSTKGVNFKVTGETDRQKTVEIISPEKNNFLHWLYLDCSYIFGCYMRCEGPVDSCIKAAHVGQFDIKYIVSKKMDHSSQPICRQHC